MAHTETCCERVSELGGWHSHPCTKPVKVIRDGKPYCTIHDPEREKARIASKCYYRVLGAYCGEPAVDTEYGYGRCAVHTERYLETQRRLQAAAPALLEALETIADQADRATGVEPRHGSLLLQTFALIAKEARDALAKA